MTVPDVKADDRCGICKHHGDVHYGAGGCSVAGCECPNAGTWGPVPSQKRL